MNRITRAHLEAKAAYLNKITNSPAEYMTDRQTNVGHFTISGAYGGYALHRTMNTSGGVHDVFSSGHMPARELAGLISAFTSGIEFSKA